MITNVLCAPSARVVTAARVGLVVLVAAMTWLALIPVTAVPVTTFWDKADHALGFFVLTLLASLALPHVRFWSRLAPAVLAYGIGLELAQSFTATRTASLLDVVADAVGILLFALAALLMRRRQARRLPQ